MSRKNTTAEPEVKRRRLRPRLAYLLLLGVMGLFAFKFVEKTQEIKRLTAQETALQMQNDKIWQDNQQQRRDIRYYQTLQFIEEDARSVLGYTKPGDTAVRLRPVQTHVVTERAAPIVPAAPPPPNWKQWWQVFFG
jgi:cell division protein FtsB